MPPAIESPSKKPDKIKHRGGDKARDARRTPSTAYNASDKLDTDFVALSTLLSLIVLVIHLAAGILIPHRRSYPEYDYRLNARVCSPAKAVVTLERGMETTIGTDASGGERSFVTTCPANS